MATTVRASSIATSAGSTAVSVSKPAGTTTGDVVIVVVNWNDGASETIADNNGATPFTEDLAEFRNNGTAGHAASVFSRRIQVGDPATYNFTLSGSQRWTAVAVTFQNPNVSSIYDVVPSSGNSIAGGTGNPVSVPAITTVTANAIHCSILCTDGISNTTSATPAGYTIQQNGGEKLLAFGTKVIASPGSTGATTYSDTAGVTKTGISFAISDIGTDGLIVTINGTDRTSKTHLNQISIDYSLGSDWTATFPVRDTLSTSSAYRPSLDQTVTITYSGTTLFHGSVTRVEDRPIASPARGTLTVITARAKSQVVDQIIVTETYASGQTLHAVVSDLATTYLAAYSITLDAAMATGATLEEQVFKDVTLREVLNHLSNITGWPWRITPSDVLEMFAAGTKTASYSLTAANGLSMGPVTWEKSRQQYVNSVYLRYGTETPVLKTWTATGNGVTTSWTLEYDSVRNANNYIVSAGYVTDDGAFSPLSEYPSGGTVWMFNTSDNTLHRIAALGNTKVATLVYSAQFPQVIIVEDAGEIASNGRFAAIFEAPDIFDKDAATELATGLLRKALAVPQWVRIATRQGFVMPGDQITLTFSDRTISGAHLITQVRVKTIAKGTPVYELTCLSGSEAQSTWTDQLKAAIGGSGANAAGGTISGSAVPNYSGHFDSEVSAFTGFTDTTNGFESKLTWYTNSGGTGPSMQLGRDDQTYRWAIIADSDHGATPGAVGKLRFHVPRRGSSIECAMSLAEPDTGGTDDFILLPGSNANLYLGDYAALMSGLSAGDSRIEGLLCANAMATSGYFERSRTTRLGEWSNVAFAAGNFTGNGSMTWTVAAGDQITYAYTLIGKTMIIAAHLDTTTVGGVVNTELRVAIPGGFTAAQIMSGAFDLSNNGTSEKGAWQVSASGTYVQLVRPAAANWTLSTDNTYIRLSAAFEVS